SFDADFLTSGPGSLRYANDFMQRRRLPTREADVSTAIMNRLYVAEPMVTCTGAKADHRLAIRGSRIELLARSLAAELGVGPAIAVPADLEKWVRALGRDLEGHRGRSLVLAGNR